MLLWSGNLPLEVMTVCRAVRNEAEDDIAEMEEERRLLYVGITRAKEKCYILFQRENDVSDYVWEIFPEYESNETRHIILCAPIPKRVLRISQPKRYLAVCHFSKKNSDVYHFLIRFSAIE